ncbi:hypothetical protein Pelo_18815 [Pelomyxa schiedti]|nr:hypothetical protein Pelo_18815 [Pelomyxa schiedti]
MLAQSSYVQQFVKAYVFVSTKVKAAPTEGSWRRKDLILFLKENLEDVLETYHALTGHSAEQNNVASDSDDGTTERPISSPVLDNVPTPPSSTHETLDPTTVVPQAARNSTTEANHGQGIPLSVTDEVSPDNRNLFRLFQAGIGALSEEDASRTATLSNEIAALQSTVTANTTLLLQQLESFNATTAPPIILAVQNTPAQKILRAWDSALKDELSSRFADDEPLGLGADPQTELLSLIDKMVDDNTRIFLTKNPRAQADLMRHIQYKIARWNEKRRRSPKRRCTIVCRSESTRPCAPPPRVDCPPSQALQSFLKL